MSDITPNSIIRYIGEIRPCNIKAEILCGWLSELDGQIYEEIMKPREGAPVGEFDKYDEFAERFDRVLLVPEPYAQELYSSYLKTKIDLEYAEMDKYNQDAAIFEAAMANFRNWYCSNHPLKRVQWRFNF